MSDYSYWFMFRKLHLLPFWSLFEDESIGMLTFCVFILDSDWMEFMKKEIIKIVLKMLNGIIWKKLCCWWVELILLNDQTNEDRKFIACLWIHFTVSLFCSDKFNIKIENFSYSWDFWNNGQTLIWKAIFSSKPMWFSSEQY